MDTTQLENLDLRRQVSRGNLHPSPADEVSEEDDRRAVASLLRRLSGEEHDLLASHFAGEAAAQLDELQHRMHGLVTKLLTFCCFPPTPAKVWGVIYALDLPLHEGLNMAERAARIGMRRASISVHAREFIEITGMPPSRWMRGEETVKANANARKNQMQP